MPLTPTQLEALVRERAPRMAERIRAAADSAVTEADLVAAVGPLLGGILTMLDVSPRVEHERTLVNGRADAVYNRLVIEYEPPRSLQAANSARANQHAIAQVKQYLEELDQADRQGVERLAGVALDGAYFIFARWRDERWTVLDPLPVTPHSTETFLRYLLALATEKALTPENLTRDFGEGSDVARLVVPALYAALMASASPKVQTLYQQWRRLFGEITGYEAGSAQLDLATFAAAYSITDTAPDAERLFFALHTYYAVFIKLLAVQVAQYYLMPKLGTSLASQAATGSVALRRYLRDMERGGVFAVFGISNFLEGDFFGWYLETWDDNDGGGGRGEEAGNTTLAGGRNTAPASSPLQAALRRLIADLARYSLVTLDVDPDETRDLLKQLYQNLMPRKLRHALGEYYTPDWLAERVLNQLGYQGDPAVRLLDPACGSGTFLVLAIKRARKYAEERMLPADAALEQILANIVGYDLNPLAVMAARTNYLLALGDLLQSRTREVSIPVYLCDSILTPSQGADLFTQHTYGFNTAVGRFAVPRSLVSAAHIDRFAALLEECVEVRLATPQFQQRLADTFGVLPEDELAVALALYARLTELEAQGINGIWARIIKNAFAPLFQGRFDLVAGNPPWVNWESLPEDYRNSTIPLWHHHGMVPLGGLKSILGSSKMDISMLMTYVAMDDYLRDNGRLGFVITQSVFKTAGAGQGFRRFVLGSGTPVAVTVVDDMADLKPFEGATNRTALVVLQRGRPTRYPVPYSLWFKPQGGSVIAESLSLEQITGDRVAAYRSFSAQPVDAEDLTSAWISGRKGAIEAVANVLGPSVYQAHAGAYTGGANAVYWLDILAQRPDGLVVVRNMIEGAKRKVENVQTPLEPDLLYPLLRGRDVQRWQASPSAYILMPKPEGRHEKAIPIEEMQVRYPKTYAYLARFRSILGERRDAVLMRSRESIPFYAIGAVSECTFAPYKVAWRYIAEDMIASVVPSAHDGGKMVIADHRLMIVPTDSESEAHFVCGALNSAPSRYIVQAYAIGTQISTHVLEHVRVPRYDPANAVHRDLSALSQAAHAATAAGDAARVHAIEAEIDRAAARLWGLTDEELEEIQKSLAELG